MKDQKVIKKIIVSLVLYVTFNKPQSFYSCMPLILHKNTILKFKAEIYSLKSTELQLCCYNISLKPKIADNNNCHSNHIKTLETCCKRDFFLESS